MSGKLVLLLNSLTARHHCAIDLCHLWTPCKARSSAHTLSCRTSSSTDVIEVSILLIPANTEWYQHWRYNLNPEPFKYPVVLCLSEHALGYLGLQLRIIACVTAWWKLWHLNPRRAIIGFKASVNVESKSVVATLPSSAIYQTRIPGIQCHHILCETYICIIGMVCVYHAGTSKL